MRFQELLEIGKFKYPVEPGDPIDDNDSSDPKKTSKSKDSLEKSITKSFNFITDKGLKYNILLTRKKQKYLLSEKNILEVNFGLVTNKTDKDSKTLFFKKTGTGNAGKIISTVVNVVSDNLTEYGDVDVIVFYGSAVERGRIKLYDRIVNNIDHYLPNYKLARKLYRKYSDYYEYSLIRQT